MPGSGRSSDLTNVVFIGSRDQIVAAFDAASWTQPGAPSLRDRVRWIRAVAELRGDRAGPLSLLLLNGAAPDLSWEKGLNDVSKRHHIRMWRTEGTWQGRQMWIGAATRDVDFAYWRPGSRLSHKIEEDIDQERDKVAYDLAFSDCGNPLDWVDRVDVPRFAHNATGDPILTDGRMVVMELTDCRAPRLSTDTAHSTPLPEHGGKLQRFCASRSLERPETNCCAPTRIGGRLKLVSCPRSLLWGGPPGCSAQRPRPTPSSAFALSVLEKPDQGPQRSRVRRGRGRPPHNEICHEPLGQETSFLCVDDCYAAKASVHTSVNAARTSACATSITPRERRSR